MATPELTTEALSAGGNDTATAPSGPVSAGGAAGCSWPR
jgi:hypothetical protein